MDATTEQITVEREVEIAASPETVWQLLTDPAEHVRWMGVAVEFDLRPGGAYRMEVIPENVARGEFVVVEPPRRLVYTWGWEQSRTGNLVGPGQTTVEYELIPTESGTLLRFTHRDLPSEESATSHAHGWEHYLERLSAAAGGNDAGIDPWIEGPMS